MIDLLFSSFVSLGAAWVLWLLMGLSVIIVAIAVERWFVVSRLESRGRRFWSDRIETWLKSGLPADWNERNSEWNSVYSCTETQFLSSVRPQGSATQGSAFLQNQKMVLEKRLSILGTLGNNAPYLGLLGTVIGIIQAFAALGQGNQEVGLAALSAGLAEALVSTAIGIAVALEAVLFFNYFTRKIKVIVGRCEVLQSLVDSQRA